MARSWAAALSNPFRGATPRPIAFLKIATGLAAPNEYVYLTDSPMSETWLSATWTPRPVEPPSVRNDPEGEGGAIALKVADLDGYWRGLIDTNGATFDFQRVTFYLTDRGVVEAGGTATITEKFVITALTREETGITFHMRPLMALVGALELPKRTLTRTDFPGMPR